MQNRQDIITDYFNITRRCISGLQNQSKEILKIVDILKQADAIYVCGNGGSSAMASHMTNDLQKIGKLRAFCLTDNTPLITAWANDEDYSKIFVRQLEVLCYDRTAYWDEPNEVIILISGSGNSKNLIEVAKWGLDNHKIVIAFIGQDGGEISKMNWIHKIYVESDMLHSENWHIILEHLIARLLE